jgi:hypothetical protein
MPVDSENFWESVKKHPDRFYIIHYSSQSLYDEGVDGLSPRITSIVVMHYATRQTVSFALHAVAESMSISKDGVESHYDVIEKELLERFFNFLRDRREKYPSVPIEVRLNLNDILSQTVRLGLCQ